MVVRSVQSFPAGSSGGPDGLCPQHLKDMLSASAENGGREFLRSLASFVNFVAKGNTPSWIRHCFFGASLSALKKKNGGIRPIAVSMTLRRLVAKCLCVKALQLLQGELSPLQVGFGTPGGVEAASHAARLFVRHLPSDHVFLKLDFKNAFNSIRRDKMLESLISLSREDVWDEINENFTTKTRMVS